MNQPPSNGHYPRGLQPIERDLIGSVLPGDRSGYRAYREAVAGMVVLAQGMRGRGHLVLGTPGSVADVSSPLSGVVAYGAVEIEGGEIVVAVREETDDQIHVEIMARPGDGLPASFQEVRRWTYSSWSPGQPSPQSATPVKEVQLSSGTVLVLSATDKRIWLYSSTTGMNRLIPITTLYGELMAVEKIRDPDIALRPGRFFEDLPKYSDVSLKKAFLSYNEVHPRMINNQPSGNVSGGKRKSGVFEFLKFGPGHE